MIKQLMDGTWVTQGEENTKVAPSKKITEEWIEEKFHEFCKLRIDSEDTGRIYLPSPYQIKDFIRSLVKEIQGAG